MSEKMKTKVAKAIDERGDTVVKNAAAQLRKDVEKFMATCGICIMGRPQKTVADMLRALANEYDSVTNKFVVPNAIWEAARKKAYDEFMNQFDALTRFINKEITHSDESCCKPEPEIV